MNLRHKSGPKAALFPEAWQVEPNRPDRFLGVVPDTAEKKAFLDAGKPYLPRLINRAV